MIAASGFKLETEKPELFPTRYFSNFQQVVTIIPLATTGKDNDGSGQASILNQNT